MANQHNTDHDSHSKEEEAELKKAMENLNNMPTTSEYEKKYPPFNYNIMHHKPNTENILLRFSLASIRREAMMKLDYLMLTALELKHLQYPNEVQKAHRDNMYLLRNPYANVLAQRHGKLVNLPGGGAHIIEENDK